MRWVFLAAVLAACSEDASERVCAKNDDCLQDRQGGVCLVSPVSGRAFCAFSGRNCSALERWGLLAGDGLAQQCVVGARNLADAPMGRLQLDPAAPVFDVVPVNGTATAAVTLTNAGVGDLGALIASVVGDAFAIAQDACTRHDLLAGASCAVTLAFHPATVGASVGRFVVAGSAARRSRCH